MSSYIEWLAIIYIGQMLGGVVFREICSFQYAFLIFYC